MTKEYCDCRNLAVWVYMPGLSGGERPFFCDECVPRGCDCNHIYCKIDAYHPPLDEPHLPVGVENIDWKWIEKDVSWTALDDEQRELPCSEYDYDPQGFEREINPHFYEKE